MVMPCLLSSEVKDSMKPIKILKTKWFWTLVALVLIFFGNFIFLRSYAPAPDLSLNFMPNMPDPTDSDVIMVISPHNDDEALGAGGYIERSIENHAKVIVVFVTNGDGHRFTTVEQFKKLYPSPDNYIQSGYQRQNESKGALSTFGLDEKNIIFLGYPDRGTQSLLTKNWDKPYVSPYTHYSSTHYSNAYQSNVEYTGKNLDANLTDIIKKYNPTIIISPNSKDRNLDHQATAHFVSKVLFENSLGTPVFSYLTHYNNFPVDSGLHKDKSITPPLRLLNQAGLWYKINLNTDEVNLKEKAVSKYASQLKDPFLARLMQSFVRKNEIFYRGI